MKRFGMDPGDACERLLQREDRQQYDPDGERQGGGHQSLRAGVLRAEEKREADRDDAASQQHAPDDGGQVGSDAEQAVPSLVP